MLIYGPVRSCLSMWIWCYLTHIKVCMWNFETFWLLKYLSQIAWKFPSSGLCIKILILEKRCKNTYFWRCGKSNSQITLVPTGCTTENHFYARSVDHVVCKYIITGIFVTRRTSFWIQNARFSFATVFQIHSCWK